MSKPDEQAAVGFDPDDPVIAKRLARKDASRRFKKLCAERAATHNKHPLLLTGTDFETRLVQYKLLIAHVEKLWSDACRLYFSDNFPLAIFVSILVIEETGKLANLIIDLCAPDLQRAVTQGGVVERSHRRKHFIAVVSGALINARLDRVLGEDVVRKLLHQAESDELEKTRQSCLYIDVLDGRTVLPSERVDAERARVLTVLAGELMADVLGHFPWEFSRMLDDVIAFERAIGMPEDKIARR